MVIRWPVAVVVVAALLLTSATLKLQIFADPPLSLLFPLGDAPGGPFDRSKTLYLETDGRYFTFAAMGDVTLTTNTTGWRIYADKNWNIPPTGAAASLPPAGRCLNSTWSYRTSSGVVFTHILKLCNYNGTHGVVMHRMISGDFIDTGTWVAQIVKVEKLYVWYPVAPDDAIRGFVLQVAGTDDRFVALYVPDISRFVYIDASKPEYQGLRFCADYFDYRDGMWHNWPSWCGTREIGIIHFRELNGTMQVDAMARASADSGVRVYVYWPVIAYYLPGPASTYLHAESS
jgi:hypothetical protein